MRPEDDAHIRFLLRLGRALHCYGYPSPNLEAALTRLADRFGLDSQFFSTPTSINLAFGPLEEQRTFMLRVEPGETNLERMAELHSVIRDVMEGGLTSEEATRRVEQILDQPSRYPAGCRSSRSGWLRAARRSSSAAVCSKWFRRSPSAG